MTWCWLMWLVQRGRCDRCGVRVSRVFWRESGGLCSDCLADFALPLLIFGGDS